MSDASVAIPDWFKETPKKFWNPGPNLLRAIRIYHNIDHAGVGTNAVILKDAASNDVISVKSISTKDDQK